MINQKYIVEYWFRDYDEISDYDHVQVSAANESEAILKAKHIISSHKRHTRNFKIV